MQIEKCVVKMKSFVSLLEDFHFLLLYTATPLHSKSKYYKNDSPETHHQFGQNDAIWDALIDPANDWSISLLLTLKNRSVLTLSQQRSSKEM